MKYYIIAGEASGDLHGANLVRELKLLDKNAEIRAWGGSLMEAQGVQLVKHIRDLAFMGFKEVVMNLPVILGNITFCKNDIAAFKPDVVIFIDYPGFNLRIAEWAKKQGFQTVYYISPQLWAWKEGRVTKVKAFVDKMMVILPFEKDFYAKHQYDVVFTGHPLLDVVQSFKANDNDFRALNNIHNQKPIVALLPGSRKQEIKEMLPVMLQMPARFPDFQFVIAGAPAIEKDFYQSFINNTPLKEIPLVQNQTYALLTNAYAALVTSGTATLETALFGVPEVVCYKGGAISYAIAKRLVKVKWISLVNLVADKEIVKELIQNEFNPDNLANELKSLIENETKRNTMLEGLRSLREKLGGEGASKRAAQVVWDVVNSRK
jgi:lipid-A-disaccharide synthase